MSAARQIEERAARYLMRQQEPDWSAAEQAELDAWRKESTAHEVAYLRLEYGWRKADRLAALRSPRAPRAPTLQHRRLAPPRRFGRATRWSASILAALVVVVSVIALYGDVRRHQTYATEVGGHEIVSLADGSRVELNTDTRLRTEVSEKSRTVWLERGEAYFDIAHDASRPFVVYAGSRRLTVLGTKFAVRRDAERVEVAVAEGRVRMDWLELQEPPPPVIAMPGHKVITEGIAIRVESRSVDEVTAELSWRRGLLMFDQTTLAEAAQEFNRYNRKKLVVIDAAASIRIGGSFEAANVDAFARLLEHSFGLKVEEKHGEIRVSS